MNFIYNFGNAHVQDVDRPDIISRLFEGSNCVDKHNQARQFKLGLEKKWLTDNAYFRLLTTMIGVSAIYTWKLASHHHFLSYSQGKNYNLLSFAGILSRQLSSLAKKLEAHDHTSFVNMTIATSISDMSMNSFASKKRKKWKLQEWMTCEPVKVMFDKNNDSHPLCQFPATVDGKTNNKYRKNRTCSYVGCQKLPTFFAHSSTR